MAVPCGIWLSVGGAAPRGRARLLPQTRLLYGPFTWSRLHSPARTVKSITKVFALFAPWWVKRRLLSVFLGYSLEPSSRLGLSWFYPNHLRLGAGARIGAFNYCRNVDQVELEAYASMGRFNWITGISAESLRFF